MEFEPGRVIGSYRVVRRIGKGGMGTVYEVEHVALGVHYALKTFSFDRSRQNGELLRTKFLEEGKVLARLKHPNLTHVFDLAFDEATGTPYFVMDLVLYKDGNPYTLDAVDTTDLDERHVLRWFEDVASALDYIHAEGIVHRDIKPGNMLLRADRHVVVTDLGVSKIFDEHLFLGNVQQELEDGGDSAVTMMAGTRHFMAPEIYRGEPTTPAADAYSLGVTMVKLLTGLWYDEHPEALARLSGYSLRWNAVLPWLLAPRPEQRPLQLRNLVERLEVKPEAVPATTVTAPAPARKRMSPVVAILCGIGLALVGLFVWLGIRNLRQASEPPEAPTIPPLPIVQKIDSPAPRSPSAPTNESPEIVVHRVETRPETSPLATSLSTNTPAEVVTSPGPATGDSDSPTNTATSELAVVETPQTTVAHPPETEDLGPIPNKTYDWLNKASRPQKVDFELANGAFIELMPVDKGSFAMLNPWKQGKTHHRVTLTRPYWMGKFRLLVRWWRDYRPTDYANTETLDAALGKDHPLSIRVRRKDVDSFCAYLTKRYRSQLPSGYVFRLPTEAEWDRAFGYEEILRRNLLSDTPCSWPVDYEEAGEVVGKRLKALWQKQALWLKQWKPFPADNPGFISEFNVYVEGCTAPHPSGVYGMTTWAHYTLDRVSANMRGMGDEELHYADQETDPLKWIEEPQALNVMRSWERDRLIWDDDAYERAHIVVGPDLVAERSRTVISRETELPAPPSRSYSSAWAKMAKRKLTAPVKVKFQLSNQTGMEFCLCPKGKFKMSNVGGRLKTFLDVEITRPFWMSQNLVTAQQWREFARWDCEGLWKEVENLFPKNPVSGRLNYKNLTAYCRFLTKRFGHQLPRGYVFRLPTEAEWEYAVTEGGRLSLVDYPGEYNSGGGRQREKMKSMVDALIKKRRWPFVRWDSNGWIGGEVFVGGLTHPNAWGVQDLQNDCPQLTLDAIEVPGRDTDASILKYADNAKDPFCFAGRAMNRVICRNFADRHLVGLHDRQPAHIVIGPDLQGERGVDEKLPLPYLKDDFGGKLLSEDIEVSDGEHLKFSSLHGCWDLSKNRGNLLTSAPIADFGEDGRCFHTAEGREHWIQVELKETSVVTGVRLEVYCWQLNVVPFQIELSMDGVHFTAVALQKHELSAHRIDLQKNRMPARFIRIHRMDNGRNDGMAFHKLLIYGNPVSQSK